MRGRGWLASVLQAIVTVVDSLYSNLEPELLPGSKLPLWGNI